jgi:hypothetical protein
MFHADRQTDMTKLIVAFLNFANARKAYLSTQKFTSITLGFNIFGYTFPWFTYNSDTMNHVEVMTYECYRTVNFSCTKKKFKSKSAYGQLNKQSKHSSVCWYIHQSKALQSHCQMFSRDIHYFPISALLNKSINILLSWFTDIKLTHSQSDGCHLMNLQINRPFITTIPIKKALMEQLTL